ncbi:nitrite reductase/ring-hydroxylating ferredoxin subunit [Halopolyspora algeriensis]|uniref:Cytochrome bc1 complex Rieske iron-sulfur subunit n=1 Tax=Halopolyspora algeriensis TaxID=1500506 RepID=A0A368VYC3_9ACTN|nr:Rieske (2Fe-2S) protein [Halopolyspora algeriensis]RCW45237.1 nitrite reductase/ring-hydroxylating ferredoxin subunit [Halopolyspora algeriensis]TQM53044.1 nitrite reductase/ring-hydroxylating ferredoxin subunit [Halopolyspora algeriensis]
MTSEHLTSRRHLLAAGGAGIGAAALSACADGSYQGSKLTGEPSPSNTPGGTQAPSQSGAALVDLADVPVGGAVSATAPDGKPVIVAQPRQGEVAAFSAVCTHMGCTVNPNGNRLHCPCHGSVFESSTGDVVNGPAERPLGTVPVHVEAGKVVTDGQ